MNPTVRPAKSRPDAFTLIELLTVMLIISILASMILASLVTAKEKAKRTTCRNNLHQLMLGIHLYGGDYNDKLPRGTTDGDEEYPPLIPTNTWKSFIKYGGSDRIVGCPGLAAPFRLGGYAWPDHGYVFGYIYLGGHEKLRDPLQAARLKWVPPATINDGNTQPVIVDLNVWSPPAVQTVVPHGNRGSVAIGDATNPDSGGIPCRALGAAGGNAGYLDGSASWKPINKMDDYPISLLDNEIWGNW